MRLFRLSRLLPGTLALAGIMMLGLASSARADLTVTLAEDGGAPTTVIDVTGSPSSPGGVSGAIGTTFGNFTIDNLSATALQNPPIVTNLSSSVTAITNTDATASHTLDIVITGSGYTSPTAPPPLGVNSLIGGTVGPPGSITTLTYESLVTISNGVQNVIVGGVPPGAFSSDLGPEGGAPLLPSLSSPYSITENIDITFAPGGGLTYSSLTNLAIGVPEPSTFAIAGLGALGMIGYGLGRRKGA